VALAGQGATAAGALAAAVVGAAAAVPPAAVRKFDYLQIFVISALKLIKLILKRNN
jgi:hypothetical protein